MSDNRGDRLRGAQGAAGGGGNRNDRRNKGGSQGQRRDTGGGGGGGRNRRDRGRKTNDEGAEGAMPARPVILAKPERQRNMDFPTLEQASRSSLSSNSSKMSEDQNPTKVKVIGFRLRYYIRFVA